MKVSLLLPPVSKKQYINIKIPSGRKMGDWVPKTQTCVTARQMLHYHQQPFEACVLFEFYVPQLNILHLLSASAVPRNMKQVVQFVVVAGKSLFFPIFFCHSKIKYQMEASFRRNRVKLVSSVLFPLIVSLQVERSETFVPLTIMFSLQYKTSADWKGSSASRTRLASKEQIHTIGSHVSKS